jgi:hypothetical protein
MTANGDLRTRNANGKPTSSLPKVMEKKINAIGQDNTTPSANTFNLLVCVGGIYASL